MLTYKRLIYAALRSMILGGVHKLCWQLEVDRLKSMECQLFIGVYKVDNVNIGRVDGKKTPQNLSMLFVDDP